MAVRQVLPGQLNEELVILLFLILIPEFVCEVLLPGFMLLHQVIYIGNRFLHAVLRIPLPEHIESLVGLGRLRLFMNCRIIISIYHVFVRSLTIYFRCCLLS